MRTILFLISSVALSGCGVLASDFVVHDKHNDHPWGSDSSKVAAVDVQRIVNMYADVHTKAVLQAIGPILKTIAQQKGLHMVVRKDEITDNAKIADITDLVIGALKKDR